MNPAKLLKWAPLPVNFWAVPVLAMKANAAPYQNVLQMISWIIFYKIKPNSTSKKVLSLEYWKRKKNILENYSDIIVLDYFTVMLLRYE